ncbi:MAG: acylphosphatase [Planctomycetota bacterium]|nr:acylphosphatase [Planctomycetota bacterium]
MTASEHVRHEFIFHGHVQGVGFRFTTEQVASRHDITGWVQNLPDRTVKCVVEGESSVINAFLVGIHEAMSGHIVDTQELQAPATGEFKGFKVRYD